ncbi:unnamed protein product [Diamesa hyperborea]
MNKSICHHLKHSSVDKTVRNVARLDNEDFHLAILQFFINCLKRKFVLEKDDLKSIDGNLVMLVYRSEKIDTDLSSLPIKSFMMKVFDAALEKDLVTPTLVSNCVVLLGHSIQSDALPDDSVMKGISIYLLSLLMKPFINIYIKRLSDNEEEEEDEDELKECISSALDMINEHIKDGISYQTLCRNVGLEFCETMAQHCEFLLSFGKDYLNSYKKFFEYDDVTIQIMALGSLKDLCDNENIGTKLVKFFFEPKHDNFLKIIWTILCCKNTNVTIATYKLLSSISKLPYKGEILSVNQKFSIYWEIFNTNRNLATECAKLMINMEKDFWLKFIHLIIFYRTDFNGVDNAIKMLCKINVDTCDFNIILKIIESNLEKPEISSCAAQIFIIMLDIIPFNHSDMIKKYNQLAEKCLNHETFLHLMSFYLKIDQEEIKSFYDNNNSSFIKITQVLLQGFWDCTSFYVMSQITNVLFLFNKLFPTEMTNVLQELFEKLYSEFLQMTIEEDHENLLICCCKLMVVCESNQLKDYLEERHITTFCTVLKGHFKDNGKLIFIRLQTTILKHMWNKLARNDLMGISPKVLVDIIRDIVVTLKPMLKNRQFDLFSSYMMVTSLLDIYIYFQPSLAKHYSCLVFQKFQNQLDKEDVDSVAEFIEHYVFLSSESIDEQLIIFKRKILQTWTSFVRQNMESPTLITSVVLLRHYNMKSELKNELINLLNVIYNQEHNCFGKTIAYTIFKNSLEIDLATFKSFTQALDEFLLKQTNDDVKLKLSQIAYISSYAIQNLVMHFKENEKNTHKNSRMMVLDFLNHFIKPLSMMLKRKLEDFLPVDLLQCGLDAKEKIKIEKFLASLKQI